MKLTKKRIIFYLAIFLLSVSVFIMVKAAGKSQELRSRAAGTAHLSLSPSSGTRDVGADLQVTVKVDAGSDKANIVSAYLSYDQGLTIKTNGCVLGSSYTGVTGNAGCTFDNTARTVHLALQASGAAGPSGVSSLATITFTGTSAGTKNISFTGTPQVFVQLSDNTTVSASVTTANGSYNIGSTAPTLTPTATSIPGQPTNTPTPTSSDAAARLFLDPSSGTRDVGADLQVTVKVDAGSDKANIVSAYLSYDQGLTIKTNGCVLGSSYTSVTGNAGCTFDNTARTVHLALQASGAAGPSGVSSLATITFTGTSAGTKNISFTGTPQVFVQLSDNTTVSASVTTANGSYQIGSGATATPTPTVTGQPAQPTNTPTMTPTPIFTVTPTPGGGEDSYKITVGEKQSLTIQIGAGTDPQISFKFKLANVETTPDLYVKLRVKDELAFLENPTLTSSCNTPGSGEKDFYIPVMATSGIYKPVPQIGISPPTGAVVPPVSSEGVVTLTGVNAGKYYTLILKGPKTRGTKMAEHILLSAGYNSNQIYNWEDDKYALQPGDLPDPNNNGAQDCTVNSVDLSLITALLPPPGSTVNYAACCSTQCNRAYNSTCPDWDKMQYADVNYDGVVNGADVANVVTTLSTKPDDDL